MVPPMSTLPSDDEIALAIAEKFRANEGTGPALETKIIAVRKGYAKLSMLIRKDMLNGMKVAHGGMIFTLADTAFAYACNSHNIASVALHASITFLSPIQLGEEIIAEAKEDASSGRTGVYNVIVFGGDGRRAAVFEGISRTLGGENIEVDSH